MTEKTPLYVFDPFDNLLAVVVEYLRADFEEFVRGNNSLEVEIPANHEKAEHFVDDNQIAFRDMEGRFRLFTIKELEDTDGEGTRRIAICEPAMNELSDEPIEDIRPYDTTAKDALTRALENTRWMVGNVADLGINSTNFYYESVLSAIEKIIDTWGGELVDRVEIDENGITGRYIDIVTRLGADTGKIWEMDKDIINITRTVHSFPKTAMYGRGRGLETEGGGYTRKITFADVEWSKANGDPVDKPLGQEWVGDEEARKKYGRPDSETGERVHRFGFFEDGDEEDPAKLLKSTWEALQNENAPVVSFDMSIITFAGIAGYEHEQVSLGDTGTAVNRNIKPEIVVEARVVRRKYDLGDPTNGDVTIGNYIDLLESDRKLEEEVDRIRDRVPIWDGATEPIEDDDFPDYDPPVPTGVEVTGAFRNIIVLWDFIPESWIAAYEVYASQVPGFAPDETNLVFRGSTGGYTHKADTNQTWYFRLRTVNRHGRASAFTEEFSATTARIVTDDILFGSVIADHLEDNLDIADKLSERTVERINEGPMEAIEYTQDQIEQTEQDILSELDTRIGDVNTDISDLLDRTEGLEGSVTTINQEVDDIEGRLSTTITELNNLDGVVSEHTTTLQQHADLISAKAEKTEVYTRAETDDLLGEKVDQTVYNNKISEIELDIDGITSRVSNTETEIGGLTGDVNSALSQIAELDIRADGISQSVSEVRNDLESRTTIQDTREDDFPPSYYWENHKRQTVEEFKRRTTMGVSKGETYGVLITIVPWSDSTGGYIKQTFRTGNYIFERTSATDDSWTPWRELEDTEGAQEKVNEAIAPVNSRLTSAETRIEQNAEQIELRATKTEVDSLEDRMSQAESQISVMSDEIDLKVDVDGIVSAINLSEEGVRISGEKIHLSGQTLIEDGIIGTAAIADAAITRAKLGTAVVDTAQIEDAAITSAKIADLAVDTAHIANAAVTNAKIANVNASKITAGIIDASRVTVRSQSGSNIVQLDGDGFRTRDSRGRTRIIINVRDWDGNEADPAFMRFLDPAGNAVGAIGSNVNNHFVIGGTGALQFDMEDNIVMAAQQFRVQTHGISRPNDYFQFSSIENTSGTYREPYFRTPFDADGYIGSASYRWWRVYSVHVHCSELHESSTREEKTNIEDADIDALQDAFDRLKLKTFYRTINGKVIDPIKGIGVIAEESPQEILDETGKSVVLRNFLAVVSGALKKQQQRIDELEIKLEGMA